MVVALRQSPLAARMSRRLSTVCRNKVIAVHCAARKASLQASNAARTPSAQASKWISVAAGLALMLAPAVSPPFIESSYFTAQARARLTPDEQLLIDIFKQARPSVVNITNSGGRTEAVVLDYQQVPRTTGSGVIWDTAGHVVTNYHVVRDAKEIQVQLSDGSSCLADVVGFDRDKDIAVLKLKDAADFEKINGDEDDDGAVSIQQVDSTALQPLALGDSTDLMVGQRVLAIGNPFGLDHTLTTGVISGTGREIMSGVTGRPIQDVIQTDAAINPGSSGGPLLDTGGVLIGINTQIISASGLSSGVGFAIPVDVVKSSVLQIIEHGSVIRPILGISFAPDQSNIPLSVKGVLVLNTNEGGPAAKAGMRGTTRERGQLVLGDIIINMNGVRVRKAADLYRVLDKCNVGDTIDIEVVRQDERTHVHVLLEGSA